MRIVALMLAVLATLAGMYFGARGVFETPTTIGEAAGYQVLLLRAIVCFAFACVFLLSGLNDNSVEIGTQDRLVEQNDMIIKLLRDLRDGKK